MSKNCPKIVKKGSKGPCRSRIFILNFQKIINIGPRFAKTKKKIEKIKFEIVPPLIHISMVLKLSIEVELGKNFLSISLRFGSWKIFLACIPVSFPSFLEHFQFMDL